MKRILTVIGVLMFYATICYGQFDVTVEMDSANRTLSVDLHSMAAGDKNITAIVVDGDANTPPLLSSLTAQDLTSRVFGHKQTKTANTQANISIPLKREALSGYYYLKLALNDMDYNETDSTYRFYYSSSEEVTAVLSALNAATSTNMYETLIKPYAVEKPILSITLDENYLLHKTDVHEIIIKLKEAQAGKVFGGLDEFFVAFKQAVAITTINKNTVTEEMLARVAQNLSLDLTDIDYTSNKSAVIAKLNRMKDIKNSKEDITTQFRIATALTMVKLSTRDSIHNILVKYNDVLGLILTGNYQTMDKMVVASVLAGVDFENPAALKVAFDAKTDPPNTGSGSNGGFSTPKVTTPVTMPNTIPEPELVVEPKVTYFNDIDGFEWARDEINFLAKKNISNGDGNGNFNPSAPITREEFLKMLLLAFDVQMIEAQTDFSDVDVEGWYYPYVATAYENDLVNGITYNQFGIGRQITRQDAVVLIARLMDYKKITANSVQMLDFDDYSLISDYAKLSVRRLQGIGVIKGGGDNKFSPNSSCTRAEIAKMIYGVLNVVEGV